MLVPGTEPAASAITDDWLRRFNDRLTSGESLQSLFADDCHWRDLGALTGTIHTFSGRDAVARLMDAQQQTKAGDFRVAADRTPPRRVDRAGIESIEAILGFDTSDGFGAGVVRLVCHDGTWSARNLMTMLDGLAAHPERVGVNRPTGQADSSKFGGPNWLDRRNAHLRYDDHDPDVLIVGGGQTGLALAARLGQLDVDALVVDSHDRPGDNWRKRYHALTLHNAVWLNDMPYMPFPSTWPVFVPKDKLAGWFEAYVEALELNFWGSTTFEAGTYDETVARWEVTLRQEAGARILHPRHVVLATGVSGIPNVPAVPGLDDFHGPVVHSSGYTDGRNHRGENVIVVGTGNSGHDVAQDLHANGATVTMVQRSSTTVVSVSPSAALIDSSYLTADSMDDCDLIALSIPYPDLVVGSQILTDEIKRLDRELVDALEAVGFRTDYGEDDTGQVLKFFRRGGGYYLDVGCSGLIVDGDVGLVQYSDMQCFEPKGMRMLDGTLIEADMVVMATGFAPQQENVRRLMGDAVADRVGPVWGYDDEGELRNMWRPTAQPGLWFSAGNFQMCRTYSKVLALQLRRALDGVDR